MVHQVDGELLLPGIVVDVEQLTPARESHHVAHDLEPAEESHRFGDDAVCISRDGDISGDRRGLDSHRLGFGLHRLSAGEVEIGDCDVGPRAGEQQDGLAPHAEPATDDQCVLAAQP